jgi:purine-nucleoside phosphorylase
MGLGVGYCGGLQPEIEIGKIIIPNKARIGEGTSRYYGKTEFSTPDQQMVKRLLDVTWRYGYEPLLGEVYSIDAPLMETPDFIEELSREGILGIDMETSALFSIAEYHSKRAAAVLVVSDKPHQSALYHSQAIEGITQDVINICIEALAG